jgi:2-methylaconitate cis-trans-isomerase PrpF
VEVGNTVTVRAGHKAGVAESTVRFGKESGKAESVVMSRTAREIMCGNVLIPERILR